MELFKIGDHVLISNLGGTYTTWESMALKMGLKNYISGYFDYYLENKLKLDNYVIDDNFNITPDLKGIICAVNEGGELYGITLYNGQDILIGVDHRVKLNGISLPKELFEM